jgi:hypothetical protein
MAEHFHHWIVCFSCIVLVLTPTMLSLLIWMVVEYWKYREKDCDVPLHMWVNVVVLIVVFNSTVNRPSPRGSFVVRCLCRWARDPENPEPTPFRVRVYNIGITVFIFLWNCTGLYWIARSGADPESPRPACHEEAPGLVHAVKVYAAFHLAFTCFMYVNMVGLGHVLRVAMRRGLLTTSERAPEGALERNTEAVGPDDDIFKEVTQCSVCLEDFDLSGNKADGEQILKTKPCRHVFHQQCLKGWLQVSRTCPLCRTDLGDLGPAGCGGSHSIHGQCTHPTRTGDITAGHNDEPAGSGVNN